MTEMALRQTSPRRWDRLAPNYARRPIADEAAYEHKLRLTQKLMTKDMTALELGCGSGSTAILHAPYVKSYLATDFSSSMIEIAREKAWSASLPNLKLELAATETLLEQRQKFDMILALSLLHLMPDWQAALPRIYNKLEPGGYLVTSTVCVGDMAWYFGPVLRSGRALGLFPHVEALKGSELRLHMKRAGFDIVQDWRPKPKAALFLIGRKLH